MKHTNCIIFQPEDDQKARVFTVQPDRYGVSVTDRDSGLSVTMDWDGEKVRAFITPEGKDEPSHIHTLIVQQKEES